MERELEEDSERRFATNEERQFVGEHEMQRSTAA